MKETKRNLSRFYVHFLFWLVYYGIEFSVEISANIFTRTSILRYLLGIGLFYILVRIFQKPNSLIKINLFIFSFLTFLLASLFLKYETFNLFQDFENPPIKVQILYVIDNFAHLFTLAFILQLYKKLTQNHLKILETENHLYEIETIYLNSKIDDHFFRNSINVFYSQLIKTESKAAKKLIKLSDFAKIYFK